MEEYSPEGVAAPVAEGVKEKGKAKVKKKEKEKVKPCLEDSLKDIFGRTGLDPDPQMRRTLMRKARKIRRKRRGVDHAAGRERSRTATARLPHQALERS